MTSFLETGQVYSDSMHLIRFRSLVVQASKKIDGEHSVLTKDASYFHSHRDLWVWLRLVKEAKYVRSEMVFQNPYFFSSEAYTEVANAIAAYWFITTPIDESEFPFGFPVVENEKQWILARFEKYKKGLAGFLANTEKRNISGDIRPIVQEVKRVFLTGLPYLPEKLFTREETMHAFFIGVDVASRRYTEFRGN
jgi:hypothetical protein